MEQIPAGMIMIWSGAIVDIPSGWRLCDGNGGTPNLRNRFVIGAGDTYDPDDTGGSAIHTHNFTTNGHDHDIEVGGGIGAGVNFNDTTTSGIDTGTTDAGDSLPPYYALAYIMKT